MTTAISPLRLMSSILLFIVGSLMFGWIDGCGFIHRSAEVPHIIDVHLIPDSSIKTLQSYSKRFFDSAYVRRAATAYNPSRYVSSYYLVDFFYPFIYCFLFLSLISGFKNTRFHKMMAVLILTCGLFDLSENTSFAYFLFHQSGHVNRVVAFCTTIKAILFSLCIVLSVLAFLIWIIRRLKLQRKKTKGIPYSVG
jgi:hypothetical protein